MSMVWDDSNPFRSRMILRELTDTKEFWRERALQSELEVERLNNGCTPYSSQEQRLWEESANLNFLATKVKECNELWWEYFGKLCYLFVGSAVEGQAND